MPPSLFNGTLRSFVGSYRGRLAIAGLFLVAVLGLSQLASQPHRAQAVTYAAASQTATRVYGQPNLFINNFPSQSSDNDLSSPYRMVVDSQDNLYLTNSGFNKVYFYPAGTITHTKTYGQSPAAYTFDFPRGVARDANGLYVADSQNNRIFYFADSLPGASGPVTYTRLYGQDNKNLNAPNRNKIGADSTYQPTGMTVDSTGGLYLADNSNSRVLYYPAGSTSATRVYGQPDFTTDIPNNGGISASSLFKPSAVALDSTGGLYIDDGENSRVLYYPVGSMTATRVYGQPDFNSNAPNNGGISANSLNNPRGLALDKNDNLYIADSYNNRILFYPAGSTTATRVYGQPDFSSVLPNNGGVGPNSFNVPTGLALDSTGGLFVSDILNYRVLYFPNSGITGTLTLLSSSSTPSVPSGQSLTLTATVKSAVPGGSFPQGQVEFIENSTVLATVTLDATGQATTTLNALSNGQHTFTAHYKGSNDFTESISPKLLQSVANTVITLTSSSNPAPNTSPLTLTATINTLGSPNTPTGTITFSRVSNGSVNLGTIVVTPTTGGATASVVVSTNYLYPGGHTFVATYNGDSNFGSNVSPVYVESLTQPASAVTLIQSSDTSTLGQAVVMTATLNPVLYSVGELTFKDGSTALQSFATATNPYTNTVVFTTTALSPGQHNLTAQYSGAYYFQGSVSPLLTHTVVPIPSSATGLTNAPNPSAYGDSVTFTATVTPITATGSVTFKFDNATPVTVSLPAGNNIASYVTSTLSVGQHLVTATYNGDANLAPSTSATVTQTVTAGPAASIVPVAGGGQSQAISTTFAAPLVAKVTDAGSNPVSGANVTFTAPGSGPSGTFAGGPATYAGTTDASGRITTTAFTANTQVGSYSVTATVSGVASPASFSITNTVGAANAITAVGGTPQSAVVSTTFASPLVALVTDSASNPLSGTNVSFTAPNSGQSGTFAGGSATYTGQTDASGRITTTAFTANSIAGSYNVTATVAGVSQLALFQLTNQAGCDPLVVTSTADDGTSCGTLRVAVATAAGGSNKLITIELPAGSVISLTTGLTLTSGIAITTTATAGVGPNSTPPIIVQGIGANSGDGLTLAAGNQLYGLWIRGFSGRQIIVPAGSHAVLHGVKTSRT